MFKRFFILLNTIRLIPHLICFQFIKNKTVVVEDLQRWLHILRRKDSDIKPGLYDFVDIMIFFPEYRTLFYERLKVINKVVPHFLRPLCSPLPNLSISTGGTGPGLYIQHGFSTVIAVKHIGRNCWVNQQVTLGYSNDTDCPTLGDNVVVGAGAKIIGNVIVGDNVIVGANAVVVKDVPPNCTVVGVPAYIVKKNGKRVTECL